MSYRIDSVSETGQVVLRFSEPVYTFDELNNSSIDVKYCSYEPCVSFESFLESKDWVEVSIVAGESSNEQSLGFQ